MAPFNRYRVVIDGFTYPIRELRSALYTKAAARLEEFDQSIKSLETRFITFTQISFTIFALVIALVSIASRAADRNVAFSASILGAVTVGISVAALLISIFSYVQWRVGRLVPERYGMVMASRMRDVQRFLRRSWFSAVFVSLALAISGGVIVYLISEPFFRDIRQQRVITKSDLDASTKPISTAIQQALDRVQRLERDGFVRSEDLEAAKNDLQHRIDEIERLQKLCVKCP